MFRLSRRQRKLFAESPRQKRSVNEHPTVRVETATVFDEATHSKLIHEKIDTRPCSADHRRQGTLRYPAKSVQLTPIPVAREQKKSPGEPPMTQAGMALAQRERLIGFYRFVRQGFCEAVRPDLGSILRREPTSFAQFARDYAQQWNAEQSS